MAKRTRIFHVQHICDVLLNYFVYASKCSNPNSKPFNFAFFS